MKARIAILLAVVPSMLACFAVVPLSQPALAQQATQSDARVAPVTKARRAASIFLEHINKREYQSARKMTFYRRDLIKLKRLRERGFRFAMPSYCGQMPPEGFQCLADVLKNGKAGDMVEMHVDGDYGRRPATWKVWDIRVYDPF